MNALRTTIELANLIQDLDFRNISSYTSHFPKKIIHPKMCLKRFEKLITLL